MPNLNVNNNGNFIVGNSNVQNDNDGRALMRIGYITLLRQPPICRRASVSLACSFNKLVALANFSSSIARILRAVSSASASATIRYVSLTAFGACLAKISCSMVALQLAIVGSLKAKRYFLSIVMFSSISFLYSSYMSTITESSSDIDISLTNIWQSWVAFRRGKRPSREIIAFEADLERNLLILCADINNGVYVHGGYNHRIVNEKKRRDIAVAAVRDRVVHRLLYDYLVPIVDPKLDYDVWSCRRGKGLHGALRRARTLTTKYSEAWVWRADVSKFFDNVNQQALKDCLHRLSLGSKALDLLDIVTDSYTLQLKVSQSVSQSVKVWYSHWQSN